MNDERFERDLRALLEDEAPQWVPVTLRASLQRVTESTGDHRADRLHRLQVVGPVMAAVALFALIGLVVATVLVTWTGQAPGPGGAPSDPVGAPSDPVCRSTSEPPESGAGDLPRPRPGQVKDIDLTGLTPNEAAAWIADRGLCISWRFSYRTNDQNTGYSEIWCTPPEGEIIAAYVDDSGIVTVFVRPLGNPILPTRRQPALGWGCD